MLNGKTKHKTSENSIHLNKTKQNEKHIYEHKKHTNTNRKLNRKQSRNLNEFFGVSNPGTAFKAKIQKQT